MYCHCFTLEGWGRKSESSQVFFVSSNCFECRVFFVLMIRCLCIDIWERLNSFHFVNCDGGQRMISFDFLIFIF